MCYCLTSEVDGDPVNGVLLTEADCPVGMSVTLSCVDTVVFDVVCVLLLMAALQLLLSSLYTDDMLHSLRRAIFSADKIVYAYTKYR